MPVFTGIMNFRFGGGRDILTIAAKDIKP